MNAAYLRPPSTRACPFIRYILYLLTGTNEPALHRVPSECGAAATIVAPSDRPFVFPAPPSPRDVPPHSFQPRPPTTFSSFRASLTWKSSTRCSLQPSETLTPQNRGLRVNAVEIFSRPSPVNRTGTGTTNRETAEFRKVLSSLTSCIISKRSVSSFRPWRLRSTVAPGVHLTSDGRAIMTALSDGSEKCACRPGMARMIPS